MNGFLIRIFGVKDCEQCQSVIKAFEYHAFPFTYIDADAPENKSLCDQFNVDEMPHIQALYNDNSKVFYTHIGYISPVVFVENAMKHTQQLEDFFKANLAMAERNVDMEQLKRSVNEHKSKPCAGCKKNQPKS